MQQSIKNILLKERDLLLKNIRYKKDNCKSIFIFDRILKGG
jgi:hypothetical protein